ncbi:Nif3-like dinuclear metal center hexameric protein [Thermodesulfobacteriota bacterium]
MMPARVADVVQILETFAPSELAEAWDNVGLQVGDINGPVTKVWVALDPALPVVKAASQKKVNLLITHHPLIFDPLKSLDFNTPIGTVIHLAIQHRIAIYAAHTNLDSTQDGVNDVLASKIGLKNLAVLGKTGKIKNSANFDLQGLGRIGELGKEVKLEFLAVKIKNKLGLSAVKVAGKPELLIRKVALCSGSGSGLLNDFLSSGAQVYISGDFRYHDARTAESLGLSLIDIGHFASEHLIVEVLARRLQRALAEDGFNIEVEPCTLESDPFVFF